MADGREQSEKQQGEREMERGGTSFESGGGNNLPQLAQFYTSVFLALRIKGSESFNKSSLTAPPPARPESDAAGCTPSLHQLNSPFADS